VKRTKFIPPSLQVADSERAKKMSIVAENRTRILAEVTLKVIKDGGGSDYSLEAIDPILKKFSDFIETEFPDESFHLMAIASQCITDALLAQTFNMEDIH